MQWCDLYTFGLLYLVSFGSGFWTCWFFHVKEFKENKALEAKKC
jgi:hypothetical protein